jgi:hypothetical protein
MAGIGLHVCPFLNAIVKIPSVDLEKVSLRLIGFFYVSYIGVITGQSIFLPFENFWKETITGAQPSKQMKRDALGISGDIQHIPCAVLICCKMENC